ncbi:MAG TPA: alpha/beta fold hydrolase, partial [Burkholderiaceae bacterium]|nr:alpha/beta fold hydrolase [Burkholderiaceae bacterium]
MARASQFGAPGLSLPCLQPERTRHAPAYEADSGPESRRRRSPSLRGERQRASRSADPRGDRPAHFFVVADGRIARVHRLGLPSGGFAGQAVRPAAAGVRECAAPEQLRTRPRLRRAGPAGAPQHRQADRRSALRARRLAVLAVQSHAPGLPAHAAMVGRGHARRTRRIEAPRGPRLVRGSAVARRRLAGQLPVFQPGRVAAHARTGRRQPDARCDARARRCRTADQRRAAIVGRDVGITPGKVVLKNRLIELIQYSPTTEVVHPEPILIVPAWIMKYYILDLSPHNSLVRYLVSQGHTVFCVSWKNPNSEDRDLGMDDYIDLGLRAAIDTVEATVPGQKIHATGYCLGGTLLSIGAAAMARDGDDRLATVTLFAAQTDFTEPGELALFIDDSQVSLLDARMAETGYLTAAQMAGAFQLLRSYDLLWSRIVSEYLMGDRASLNDLMAWNADATRMPARMHSEYLRRLFLNNDLAEGRYQVDGRLISMHDLRVPVFAVGTVKDHVAPWRSAFKLHSQIDT